MGAQLFNEIVLGFQDQEENTTMNPPDKMEVRNWDDYDFVLLNRGTVECADKTVQYSITSNATKQSHPGKEGAVDPEFIERYTKFDAKLDALDETISHFTRVAECLMSEQERKGGILKFIEDQKRKQALLYI